MCVSTENIKAEGVRFLTTCDLWPPSGVICMFCFERAQTAWVQFHLLLCLSQVLLTSTTGACWVNAIARWQ